MEDQNKTEKLEWLSPETPEAAEASDASGTRAEADADIKAPIAEPPTAVVKVASKSNPDTVPTTTGLLTLRPPEEEVRRRAQVREEAPTHRYVFQRVLQVLLAIFTPYLLLVGAIRFIASPLFLKIEYLRPGFPSDTVFAAQERLNTGSYVLDYLFNLAQPSYLGNLLDNNQQHIFTPDEVSHMADVKTVFGVVMGVAAVLLVLSIVIMVILARTYKGGIRRALFAGSLLTLVLVVVFGVLASLGWDRFFVTFHKIFFSHGNWEFSAAASLIRLFPGQFWLDAGICIGAVAGVAALIILAFTWPTKKRRTRALDMQEFIQERAKAENR